MKQIDHYIKLKKDQVAFVCTYLEAFEGMCAIRTPNPKPGDETVIQIMVTPDLDDDLMTIMENLKNEVPWEEVEP